MAQYKRHAQKGDFQPQPNCPCLNMVTAVIDHYRRQPNRLQTIFLNPIHWRLINEELKTALGSDYEKRDSIELEGCDVDIQLSSLQVMAMRYKFYPVKTLVGEA